MTLLRNLNATDLAAVEKDIRKELDAVRKKGLRLNMTRGRPSPEQLDLSNSLLSLPGNGDWQTQDGSDTRNYYGGAQGLPEARSLFSTMLGSAADQVLIGNNSSLALMHDCVVFALLKGVADGSRPWREQGTTTFLCPTPGYDRHFAICEEFGIRMIPVAMTGMGPDITEVERLVRDPSVKGMWCVPKYSNPTGETYSAEVVQRLAAMRTGAADFRLFWDNAYCVHHLTDVSDQIPNILELCNSAGNPNRVFVFASTSKMTFAGAGLALFASSPANVRWLAERYDKRSIGPNKVNQLRHVRLLRDEQGIARHMQAHRRILAPKFRAVDDVLTRRLLGTGVATWTQPRGGYFISVEVLDGCAKRVVEIAKGVGLELVPAGASFPYRHDPHDRHLRIAPSFPKLEEITYAAEVIALSILMAAAERLLARMQ